MGVMTSSSLDRRPPTYAAGTTGAAQILELSVVMPCLAYTTRST
jgi:hypothetical protein